MAMVSNKKKVKKQKEKEKGGSCGGLEVVRRDLHIFSRLSLCIVESPIITDEAISLLKQFCQVIIVICNFFPSHILYLHRARLELWLV